MKNTLRFLCALIALVGCLAAAPALAKTHHRHSHSRHHAHAKSVSSKYSSMTLKAQRQLVSLGYLRDRPDGIIGAKTAAALKKFQRDHGFKVTGTLTTETYNALIEMGAEKMQGLDQNGSPIPKPSQFYATHPDFYGHYNQQYADPMQLSPAVAGNGGNGAVRSQVVASRFAKIDVSENAQGPFKSYVVTVNGQPLFRSDDQPSVIGISRTYDLGNEDAILFSTYRNLDPICSYKTYLFAASPAGTNLQEISNCTRGYQAVVKEGSLWITFPEFDDNRPVGATWRYEKGSLQRL